MIPRTQGFFAMRRPKTIDILHWFRCLLATACSVTSQDNCFQSLVYIFAPPKLNYVTGRLSYISGDRGNEACSHFDKQINLTSHLTIEGQSEPPHLVKRCSECIEGWNVSRDASMCKDIFPSLLTHNLKAHVRQKQ